MVTDNFIMRCPFCDGTELIKSGYQIKSGVGKIQQYRCKSKGCGRTTTNPIGDREPIHGYFSLSYAEYIAIPRSVLQSMPIEWQHKFVKCMKELDETIDWRQNYWVYLRDSNGRFTKDKLADYERGRRRIPYKDNKDT